MDVGKCTMKLFTWIQPFKIFPQFRIAQIEMGKRYEHGNIIRTKSRVECAFRGTLLVGAVALVVWVDRRLREHIFGRFIPISRDSIHDGNLLIVNQWKIATEASNENV